jgi:hypothetical protein
MTDVRTYEKGVTLAPLNVKSEDLYEVSFIQLFFL